ncbi:DUF4407 domain-containing protein [Actinacidiphila alni]|uniref:DUF4407 domain-containing protein n=1 Tax=Actinacidiphila alni TaxID=380248 RepID=UPI00345304C9
MSNDTAVRPAPVATPQAGPARRPAPRDHGRLLRVLTGVDEELLGEVRHERSKFTSLGGVVLGTAVVAAFSMWNFATEALGRVSLFAALPTVIWFLFILNLDRWLITPVPGTRRRIGPVVLRLLVALMLGVIVAEPLVLRIFATAIEEHIAQERADDLDVLRGRLEVCTTETSGAGGALPANCPGRKYVVTFGATSAAKTGQLKTLRADAAALQQRVNQENHDLAALDAQVRDECRQLIRDAASGLLERTSECQRLRAQERDFRKTHAIGAEESRLAGMNRNISVLDNEVTAARGSYEKSRAAAIDQRLAKEREQQKSPGVLERMQALDDLATGKAVLFCGIWLVRALFVFLDVLPVLAKFLGGESTYERMLTSESICAVRMHAERVRLAELRAAADTEIAQHAINQEIERSRAESEAAHREVVARTNIRTRQAINALEEELRRASVR